MLLQSLLDEQTSPIEESSQLCIYIRAIILFFCVYCQLMERKALIKMYQLYNFFWFNLDLDYLKEELASILWAERGHKHFDRHQLIRQRALVESNSNGQH